MTKIESLRREIQTLRGRIIELERRAGELERSRDAIQADSNRALEAYRVATMQDQTTPATTATPIVPGYGNVAPHIPRPTVANEVLPPERRASWARGKTEFDR